MQIKKHLSAEVECLTGIAQTYSEFINQTCTRQVTIIGNTYYASSNLKDWNEDVGYLLYDGDIDDLDLTETDFITVDEFELIWQRAIQGINLDDYIHYQVGDASNPLSERTLILHIVNNLGKWGKGFVLSLSKRYPQSKSHYINWFESDENFGLGQVDFYQPNENIVIGNMVAQNGIKRSSNDTKQRVDYEALDICLQKVADYALLHRLEIQAPKFGSGLGGGDWNIILDIIKKNLAYKKIDCKIISQEI